MEILQPNDPRVDHKTPPPLNGIHIDPRVALEPDATADHEHQLVDQLMAEPGPRKLTHEERDLCRRVLERQQAEQATWDRERRDEECDRWYAHEGFDAVFRLQIEMAPMPGPVPTRAEVEQALASVIRAERSEWTTEADGTESRSLEPGAPALAHMVWQWMADEQQDDDERDGDRDRMAKLSHEALRQVQQEAEKRAADQNAGKGKDDPSPPRTEEKFKTSFERLIESLTECVKTGEAAPIYKAKGLLHLTPDGEFADFCGRAKQEEKKSGGRFHIDLVLLKKIRNQERAKDRAWARQNTVNPDGIEFVTSDKGEIKPLLANAELMLRHKWAGVLAFDEFKLCVTTIKDPPGMAEGQPWPGSKIAEPWTDNDDRLTCVWSQRNGVLVSDEVAGKAVQTVARDQRVHPVRQYLDALVWDGVPRLEGWLIVYLGVKDTTYTRAVGVRWMVAAVARIYRPGCKADCCLILEGPQGARKSTALRVLFQPWFTDEIAELGSKDAALAVRGIWCIELSELDAMNNADVSKVKAFMSRNSDRFREPYARQVVESPRQCVFAGTVNKSEYLRDETGGRRFWPVVCGEIHIDDLERDRDQIMAEAAARYRAGSTWWLDTLELNRLATAEQGNRYTGDPWDELLSTWLTDPTERHDDVVAAWQRQYGWTFSSTSESVTITDVLLHAIGKRPDMWTQSDRIRVARSLRSMGWERYRQRQDDGKLEWRYQKLPQD